MPLMKPPHDSAYYNGQRPLPGAFVEVLPQDVKALELEDWKLAGDVAAPVPIAEVVITEETADE